MRSLNCFCFGFILLCDKTLTKSKLEETWVYFHLQVTFISEGSQSRNLKQKLWKSAASWLTHRLMLSTFSRFIVCEKGDRQTDTFSLCVWAYQCRCPWHHLSSLVFFWSLSQNLLFREWCGPQWAGACYISLQSKQSPPDLPTGHLLWAVPQLKVSSRMTLSCVMLTFKTRKIYETK